MRPRPWCACGESRLQTKRDKCFRLKDTRLHLHTYSECRTLRNGATYIYGIVDELTAWPPKKAKP